MSNFVQVEGIGGGQLAPGPAAPAPTGSGPTTAHVLFVAGQSQTCTPNTSQATVPANIAAIPAATASSAGVRIQDTTTNALQPYIAASGSNGDPFDSSERWYGPEAEYARRFMADNPSAQLVIVKVAVPSTPLQKGATLQNGYGGAANSSIIYCWDPSLGADTIGNSDHTKDNINLALRLKSARDAVISALQSEGKAVHQLGMIWCQGQNDAQFAATAATYGTALAAFHAWVRSNVLTDASAPFIISMVEDNANWPYSRQVRSSQIAFATTTANAHLVITDDFTIGADTFHYDAASTIVHGGRCYDAASSAATLYSADAFQRANGALGSTPIGGRPWSVASGAATVAGDQLAFSASSGTQEVVLDLGVAGPVTMAVDFVQPAEGAYLILYTSASGAGGLILDTGTPGQANTGGLRYYDAGTGTSYSIGSAFTGIAAGAHRIRLAVSADNFGAAWLDGALLAAAQPSITMPPTRYAAIFDKGPLAGSASTGNGRVNSITVSKLG